MKKYWQILVILALIVFSLVLIQPFTYPNNDSSHNNLVLVKLGDKPVFCVSDQQRAEIIGKRLEKIAEDNSLSGSFNTNYLLATAKDSKKTLAIEIPYLLITLNNQDKVAIFDGDKISWETLTTNNQQDGQTEILKDVKFKSTLTSSIAEFRGRNSNPLIDWSDNILLYILAFGSLLIIYILWIQQSDWLINNRVCWTIFLTIALILSCSLLSRFFIKNIGGYVTFVIPIIISILGGFYGSLESIKTAKIDKALEYIKHWDSSDLQKHRQNLDPYIDAVKNADLPDITRGSRILSCNESQKNALEKIRNFQRDQTFDLIAVCNFCENLYILIKNNLVDEQIIKNAFKDLYQTRFYKVCYLGLRFYEGSMNWDDAPNDSRLINTDIKPSRMSNNLRSLKDLLN
jgi:hypothetical protein